MQQESWVGSQEKNGCSSICIAVQRAEGLGHKNCEGKHGTGTDKKHVKEDDEILGEFTPASKISLTFDLSYLSPTQHQGLQANSV